MEQETPASKQRKQWVENPQGSGHAAGAGVTQRAGCSARGKPSPMLGSKASTGAQPCPFGVWIGPSWLQEAGREGQDCSWSVSAKGQEEGMRLRKPRDTGNQRRGTNRVQMLQAKNASGSREQSEEGHAVGTARGTYSQVCFLEQAMAFEFREVTTADEIWMGHLAPVCLQAGFAARLVLVSGLPASNLQTS